jgi:pyocin large subunit-like protein
MVGGELGSRLEDALWGNPDTLQDHFDRYGSDFGATDPIDFAEKARSFFDNGANLPTKVDPQDGTIRMFNPDTNIFGAYNADGSTKSLFKPTSPDHWSRQKGNPPVLIGP